MSSAKDEGRRILIALQHALHGRGSAKLVDARRYFAGSARGNRRHPPQVTLNVADEVRAALAGSPEMARYGIGLVMVDAEALAAADETMSQQPTAGSAEEPPTGETHDPQPDPDPR